MLDMHTAMSIITSPPPQECHSRPVSCKEKQDETANMPGG